MIKALLEILAGSAIVISLYIVGRYLWRKYIGKNEPNRHAVIEEYEVTPVENGAEVFLKYRLPVAGKVVISEQIDQVAGKVFFNDFQEVGLYKIRCTFKSLGTSNKISFKAPGTHLMKTVK
ncbi:hypothetical protein [Luteibaculum oceani]|uniref:Uncharacterized protein n=1 Tax=Luteibaculum oceani TaxID=1294296 RepID=A0A5C6VA49_9FLAO|nr:hypothetical protein [Luteibaculum oceani]TXC82127.1 hypothetical protein FRX97_03265 [Luteibaculum oceani]